MGLDLPVLDRIKDEIAQSKRDSEGRRRQGKKLSK